jgi:hypothetical protein
MIAIPATAGREDNNRRDRNRQHRPCESHGTAFP